MGRSSTAAWVALLGPLHVRVEGEERAIGGPVRRALLATLALRPGEVLSVDLLCELVWDGAPPPTAESALRVHVSQLRRALGRPELVERVGSGYRLAIDPEQVDVTRFLDHARSGRDALASDDLTSASHHLEAAQALWRGAPLADIRTSTAVDVERLFSQRSELDVDLAELRMRREGSRADPSDLAALTVERPFDERVWGLLVTAQYRAGRQAEALETYHRAAAALRETLGVEPTAGLRRLQEQILRHDPLLDPPQDVVVDLPAYATSLVGREPAVDDVVEVLAVSRLVTLTGLGGVGKTRLSVAVAERHARRAGADAVFVPLSDLDDPALVPRAVAAALGSFASTPEDLAAAVGDRELLIVLDNCEHVTAGLGDLVPALLGSCPRLRLLATSRVPLQILGESVWVTPPLALTADDGALPGAVRLFRERASQSRPGSALEVTDEPLVREATALLGGIPLAIELAAAQCSALTVADVVDQLRRSLDAGSTARDRPARHRTMAVALGGTLAHVSPAARTLLARMLVFRSPVGLEDLIAVCSDDVVRREDVAELLGELVDTAVVSADVTGERGRYRLLPPVRRLAPDLLDRLGQPEEPQQDRHLEHWLKVVRTASATAASGAEAESDAQFDAAAADLRAALEHAVQAAPAQGLALAAGLAAFWRRRRLHCEGRVWLRRLLDADRDADPGVRAAALHAGGGLAWDDGDREDAEALLTAAKDLRTSLGDDAGLALTLNNLAGLASDRGDHRAAHGTWLRALDLFTRSGHGAGAAAVRLNLGIAADKLGWLDDAAAHLAAARDAFRDRGAAPMEALALERLATIHARRGERRQAMTLVRSAQAIYDDDGSPEQRARLLWHRALRHRDLDEGPAAREHLSAAARAVLDDELLDAWWVSSLLETAGALELSHDPERTAQLLGAARAHRERSGHGADPMTVLDLDAVMTALREALGPEPLTEEMAVGATRSVRIVVGEVAGVRPRPDLALSARTAAPPGRPTS